MQPVFSLLQALVACPSVTPDDASCQKIISKRLQALGFQCENLPFADVTNLWARYGDQAPLFVFSGHTDVVPEGPLADWTHPPFQLTEDQDFIYGRGVSDMKGALAAMVIAAENFIRAQPKFSGSIAFLLTSDEEGPSINGTKKVIETLTARHEKIDYCIVGEPSSNETVGDLIRVGRRGSLHGKLAVHGKQGHVAYPQLSVNPIHKSMLALHELAHTIWDEGNSDFPPTSFQMTNVKAGSGAANVVPGHLEMLFNFRFSTAVSVQELQNRATAILNKIGLHYDLNWHVGAEPFLTKKGKLLAAVKDAIEEVVAVKTQTSTSGGTSDARFIAPTGAEVVELGVSHQTAHHIDEHVKKIDVENLALIYQRLLEKLFSN